MAKVCGATFGLFLLLLIDISSCVLEEFQRTNKYYTLSELPQIDCYDIVRLRSKRSPSGDEKTHYEIPTQSESNSSTTVSTLLHSENAEKTNKSETSIVVNTVNQDTTNLTSTIVLKDQNLLGVNGTGQRKDVLQKPSTIIVSEPIEPTTKKPNGFPKKVAASAASGLLPTEPSLSDEVIASIDVPDNDTLTMLNKNNYTLNQTVNHHSFYNSSIYIDKTLTDGYWESFKNISANSMLSMSHRRAMTVQLKFDFPFYGHPIRNLTVATGGFLYTGEYIHAWLAATQYIAPLMANFDSSISDDSFVRYHDNGTAFTVIWEKVSLQDRPDVGTFTFSATLYQNGDIVFAYYNIPIFIETIQDDKHPVKVGLSDAYIIDKVVFFARRKTIYEYHRVNFASQDIQNATVIYLTALDTCLGYTDCQSCLNHNTTFDCAWCPTLNKCSTGTDRKRQDWLLKGCDRVQISNENYCSAIGEKGNNAVTQQPNDSSESTGGSQNSNSKISTDSTLNDGSKSSSKNVQPLNTAGNDNLHNDEKTNKSTGVVLGFMIPICFVMTILVWIMYAYRNPHTKSGQLLIQTRNFKYRPSQWSWRRGEARYTAATIHM